jgi:hypothetical protein
VIVNQSFIRQSLGGQNPIGRRVRYAAAAGEEPGRWQEIVGVVNDLDVNSDRDGSDAAPYDPLTADGTYPVSMAVRVGHGFGVLVGWVIGGLTDDELTVRGHTALLAVAALMMGLACALPAWRALRIQPTEALRDSG